MAGRPVPWGEEVDAQLADGEWHVLEDVIAAAVATVPPGIAWRVGERQRQHGIVDGSVNGGARYVGDDSTSVATGARHLVVKLIGSRKRSGKVEVDGEKVRRVLTGSAEIAQNGAREKRAG